MSGMADVTSIRAVTYTDAIRQVLFLKQRSGKTRRAPPKATLRRISAATLNAA